MIIRRIQNDELYHHGIKGQNWGIKNGPPYPLGSSVSTGHRLLKKKKVNKNAVDKAYDVPKKLSKFDEGLGKNLNNFTAKEKKQREMIKKGLKVTAIVGGTLLASAALYYGGNYVAREYLGKTLRNKEIYRMTLDKMDDIPKAGRIYVSDNILDRKIYKGRYGKELLDRDPLINMFNGKVSNNDQVYENILKVSKAKIAPNTVARKEFNMLYNGDKEFKSVVDKNFEFGRTIIPVRSNLWNKAINGKSRSRYDAFNITQAFGNSGNEIDPRFMDNINKFYDALKKKGYHGIYDINDIKYSSYNTKSPLILFDTTNIKKHGEDVLDSLDVRNAYGDYLTIKNGEDIVKSLMPSLTGLTVISGGGLYLNNRQDKAAKTLRSKEYQDAYKKNTK